MPDGVTVSVVESSVIEEEGFAALAVVTAEQVTIAIADGMIFTRPLAIQQIIDSKNGNYAAADIHIIIGNGSQAKIMYLQTGEADIFFLNQRIQLTLGKNTKVELDTLIDAKDGVHSLQDWQVDLAEQAHLTTRTMLVRGKWTRQNWDISLIGSGAIVDLAGLYAPTRDKLADMHLTVRHSAPDCRSTQLFRGIIGQQGTGVWRGAVIVDDTATGTEVQQSDRNILLADTAVMHAQPHMQIHTDDVIASHGVTSGQLDQQALLYLRSRGVSAEQAAELLMLAHAEEVISRVPYAAWQEHCMAAIHDTISLQK